MINDPDTDNAVVRTDADCKLDRPPVAAGNHRVEGNRGDGFTRALPVNIQCVMSASKFRFGDCDQITINLMSRTVINYCRQQCFQTLDSVLLQSFRSQLIDEEQATDDKQRQ